MAASEASYKEEDLSTDCRLSSSRYGFDKRLFAPMMAAPTLHNTNNIG